MNQKPDIVIILSRFPYPLEKGDKLRAYYQIKELSAVYSIHLFSITDKSVSIEQFQAVKKYCASLEIIKINLWTKVWNMFLCLFNKNPFQTGYFLNQRGKRKFLRKLNDIQPVLIYNQLIRTTEYSKNYHDCPKVLDYMDALSKGIERRIETEPIYKKWLFQSEANRLKRYERTIFEYFERKTIISKQDRQLIMHPKRNEIEIIANGISDEFLETIDIAIKYDIVFVGNLSYAPNIEAVHFILEKILPLNSNWTCLIAGANPGSNIKRLIDNQPNTSLMASVKDIRDAYRSGRVFVAPMFIGTGMQNKLLEAMALGVPCVTTPLANNAINAQERKEVIVAAKAEDFAMAINELLNDRDLYQHVASNARELIKNNFSWKSQVSHLESVFNELISEKS